MVTREWEERETENWPAWHQVGRHLRFAPALVDLTTAYASRLDLITSTPWAISSGSSVGARGYVAIHARHGGAIFISLLSRLLELRFSTSHRHRLQPGVHGQRWRAI